MQSYNTSEPSADKYNYYSHTGVTDLELIAKFGKTDRELDMDILGKKEYSKKIHHHGNYGNFTLLYIK